MKDRIARLIGHAVVGYARIMDRAFAESQAAPPATNITLLGVMAKLTIPIFWITKKLKDAKERAIVEATFKEYEATGKVIDTLTDDDYTIRKAHCEEVLKKPLEELDEEEPKPIGTAHGIGAPARPRPTKSKPVVQLNDAPRISSPLAPREEQPPAQKTPKTGSAPAPHPAFVSRSETATVPKRSEPASRPEEHQDRYYLTTDMPVEKAPSIGAKTADLLEQHGVSTVGDLLAFDPDRLAESLNDRHIDSYTILTWQMQADLCCDVPNLRGHDAQMLTACGVSHRGELASAEAASLLKKVEAFVTTPAGERILRDGKRPDLVEVTNWIRWANRPEQSKAA